MGAGAPVKPKPKKPVAKVDTKAKTPTVVVAPEKYFGFVDHTTTQDLSKTPLKIKQVKAFTDKDTDKGAAESLDAELEIWEMRADGQGDERKGYLLVKIKGKVTKTEGYNFEVTAVEPNTTDVPQAKKPKSGKAKDLFMTAKLQVLGLDDKERGLKNLEIVLPPMEYDETLELRLAGKEVAAVGFAKVTFSSYDAMAVEHGVTIDEQTTDIPFFRPRSPQKGNVEEVIVHCMCAIHKPGSPKRAYDVPENLKIFKDNGVSAHYVIDRAGKVVEAVEIINEANHAYGANTQSIGIELLGLADDHRKIASDHYDKLKKEYDKKVEALEKDRKVLEDKLVVRKGEKAAGKKTVKVGGSDMDVDEAISKIEAAIAEINGKIAAVELDPWAVEWEEFIFHKDTDGEPLAFKYTAQQYESLGKLIEVISRRYGYKKIRSHHKVSPARKFDPGKFFDWGKVTPFFLPGSLSGSEAGSGAQWTVKI